MLTDLRARQYFMRAILRAGIENHRREPKLVDTPIINIPFSAVNKVFSLWLIVFSLLMNMYSPHKEVEVWSFRIKANHNHLTCSFFLSSVEFVALCVAARRIPSSSFSSAHSWGLNKTHQDWEGCKQHAKYAVESFNITCMQYYCRRLSTANQNPSQFSI